MPLDVVFPEAIKAEGNISVTVVPKASLTSTSTPSLADITTAGVNASLYLYSGSGAASSATNTGTAPRRLGSKDVFNEFGETTHTIGDLQYVYSPQADDTDPANAVKTVCVEGAEVYLIYRYGVDSETPLAAADKVNIWLAELGPQNETPTGDGEFDQLAVSQAAIVKAPPIKGVALVA